MAETPTTSVLFVNKLAAKTQEEYKATPFSFGGTSKSVDWTGQLTARTAAIARATASLESVEASADGPWPEEHKAACAHLLSKYYSIAALRLLAGASGVDLPAQNDSQGRTTIVEACCVAKVPLCSPPYLAAFVKHVQAVVSGEQKGQALSRARALAHTCKHVTTPASTLAPHAQSVTCNTHTHRW